MKRWMMFLFTLTVMTAVAVFSVEYFPQLTIVLFIAFTTIAVVLYIFYRQPQPRQTTHKISK